jgi:hypothetical protein
MIHGKPANGGSHPRLVGSMLIWHKGSGGQLPVTVCAGRNVAAKVWKKW